VPTDRVCLWTRCPTPCSTIQIPKHMILHLQFCSSQLFYGFDFPLYSEFISLPCNVIDRYPSVVFSASYCYVTSLYIHAQQELACYVRSIFPDYSDRGRNMHANSTALAPSQERSLGNPCKIPLYLIGYSCVHNCVQTISFRCALYSQFSPEELNLAPPSKSIQASHHVRVVYVTESPEP
jgi:hypothetical protein